jgi:hypothetical protein
MNVSFLSTLNAPLLGYIIQAFERHEIPIYSIFFDEKDVSAKDKLIHEERTQGILPPSPLCTFDHLEIPTFFMKNHGSEAAAAFVKKHNIDILVNAGTPRILKPHILTAPNIGVIKTAGITK